MHYFSSCQTPDEAKRLCRQLALEHHPDKGGSTQVMQNINIEYAKYLKGSGYNFENIHNDYNNDELFREFEEFVKTNPDFAVFVAIGLGAAIIFSTLIKFGK